MFALGQASGRAALLYYIVRTVGGKVHSTRRVGVLGAGRCICVRAILTSINPQESRATRAFSLPHPAHTLTHPTPHHTTSPHPTPPLYTP